MRLIRLVTYNKIVSFDKYHSQVQSISQNIKGPFLMLHQPVKLDSSGFLRIVRFPVIVSVNKP